MFVDNSSLKAADFFQRGNEGTRVIFIEGKYIVIVLAGDVIPRVFRLQGIKFYIIYTYNDFHRMSKKAEVCTENNTPSVITTLKKDVTQSSEKTKVIIVYNNFMFVLNIFTI